MKCKSEVKKPLKAFSISEKRVRRLEKVLDNYLDLLKEPKLKDQIIKSFNFKIPVAYVKLYDNKTERRTKLIEGLQDFFFVGEVYFYSEPKESKLFGVILVSRFKDLLDVATYYAKKYNGQFDRFSDLSRVLSGKPLKDVAKYCSQDRIKELERVLGNYLDIFDDGGTIDQVLRAFKSEKPVTSIGLVSVSPSIVKKLIEELEEFFFVGQGYSDPDLLEYAFSGDLFVSRFKNLLDILVYYSNKHRGVFARFADLAGFLLLGKPPKEIAQYCSQKRLKKHNFIK